MPTSPFHRDRIARTALLWVVVLFAANLAFNLVARALGWPSAYTSFLWRADDNFGDFFSLLHTYPGGDVAVVTDRSGLHAILPPVPLSLAITTDPPVTNLHMMPLSTIIDLGFVRLLRWLDPVAVFVAVFAALLGAWAATAWRFAATKAEAWTWIGVIAFSYPLLMTLARGNLFAGLTALFVVQALLLGVKRRAPVVAAVLLAAACNFRPNAILFAAPLLLLYWPQKWRFGGALGVAGLAILAASLTAATALFPAYTVAAIRQGLANYHTLYVGHGWGLAYGSSLYGALRILVGPVGGIEGAALLASLAILGAGSLALATKRIDEAVFVFLTAASYALGSTVLGDYHLLAFVAVPMALAATAPGAGEANARMRRLALTASCLMLAPKNYLFVDDPGRPVSMQALFNPLLLLGVAILILAAAFARSAARTYSTSRIASA